MMRKIKALIRRRRPGWAQRRAGDAARDARNWTAAVQAYEEYLAINPADSAIWVQAGHVRKESGDLVGAERAYRRAVEIDHETPDPAFQLGELMKRLERREEAVQFYRRSAALGSSEAARELAGLGVLLDAGDVASSGAVSAAPDTTALRLLLDAQAARDLRRWEEAERLYRAYLQQAPGSARATAELAAMRKMAAAQDVPVDKTLRTPRKDG